MIEYDKVDAALFAIEGFVSRLITHNDNAEHADYYLSMIRNLRGSISRERFNETAISHEETDDEMEKRLRRVPRVIQPRGYKKQPFTLTHRKNISKGLKKSHKKKVREAQKKVRAIK